jgi:hypothetical protein
VASTYKSDRAASVKTLAARSAKRLIFWPEEYELADDQAAKDADIRVLDVGFPGHAHRQTSTQRRRNAFRPGQILVDRRARYDLATEQVRDSTGGQRGRSIGSAGSAAGVLARAVASSRALGSIKPSVRPGQFERATRYHTELVETSNLPLPLAEPSAHIEPGSLVRQSVGDADEALVGSLVVDSVDFLVVGNPGSALRSRAARIFDLAEQYVQRTIANEIRGNSGFARGLANIEVEHSTVTAPVNLIVDDRADDVLARELGTAIASRMINVATELISVNARTNHDAD